MTTMRLAGNALGVALVVFGPSCARADIVTYTATGTVGGVNAALQGQFTTGQAWTYTFTLNTAVLDSDPSPSSGVYLNALISSSGSIGSYHFSTGAGAIQVTNSSFLVISGPVTGYGPITGPNIGVDQLARVSFQLQSSGT